jgi:hypothetical protein
MTYTERVLERAGTRALPLVSRMADVTPVVPTCCNACRSCTTVNVLGLLTAAGSGLVAGAAQLYARARPRRSPGATRA